MEKRKVEIEYLHAEPGERVRLIYEPEITGTVVDVQAAGHFQHAVAVIRCDQSGKLGKFNTDVLEPIPEPPITEAEIVQAIKHKDFRSFCLSFAGWGVELTNPYKWTQIYPSQEEALEALVRELRKRDADANKKEHV